MSPVFRIIATVCFCLIAFSLFYYYVIFLPSEKRAERAETVRRAEAARSFLAEKESGYRKCIKEVRDAYVSDWDGTCRLYKKRANCALPRVHSARLDALKSEKEDRCLKELQALVPK